jgi:hypothetical protein
LELLLKILERLAQLGLYKLIEKNVHAYLYLNLINGMALQCLSYLHKKNAGSDGANKRDKHAGYYLKLTVPAADCLRVNLLDWKGEQVSMGTELMLPNIHRPFR